MGFRFRRTVRIAPGVRLNLGKAGVSASFGRRGASVTVGKNGTHANVGIPGTGISYRTRVDGGGSGRDSTPERRGTGPLATLGIVALILFLALLLG